MLTERCKVIIDEAITAGGNLSKLSPEALAHLETCIECRRNLEAIKALKASTASVIPAASLALKSKIASNLELAMQARKTVSAVSSTSKSAIAAGSVIVCLGLAGTLSLSVLLSENKNPISDIPNSNNPTTINSTSNEPIKNNSASSSIEIDSDKISKENTLLKNNRENEDMRSHEPIKYPTQNLPSAKKDSDI